MKLKDLQKVYSGDIHLTILAYFENGKYYSFRTYGNGKVSISIIDDDILECEVISIRCDYGNSNNCLWIDVKEIIPNRKE